MSNVNRDLSQVRLRSGHLRWERVSIGISTPSSPSPRILASPRTIGAERYNARRLSSILCHMSKNCVSRIILHSWRMWRKELSLCPQSALRNAITLPRSRSGLRQITPPQHMSRMGSEISSISSKNTHVKVGFEPPSLEISFNLVQENGEKITCLNC